MEEKKIKSTKTQGFSQLHKRLLKKEFRPRGEDAFQSTFGKYKKINV